MSYHQFQDRSKRKPFECGVCGRDIADPYHQPSLAGIPVSEKKPMPMQAGLFDQQEPVTSPNFGLFEGSRK